MGTQKIKMLTTEMARDLPGEKPITFEAGKIYDVGPDLFRAFVEEMKCATKAGALTREDAPADLEEKTVGADRHEKVIEGRKTK